MPTQKPVPSSPQDRDPPGRPADVRGIDLNAPAHPGALPTEPHLPHERDQNKDMTGGEPDAQVQQGYRDLERGLVDTDTWPPAEDARQRLKR